MTSVSQPSGRGGAGRVDGGRISQIDDPVGGHGSTGAGNKLVVVVTAVVLVMTVVVVGRTAVLVVVLVAVLVVALLSVLVVVASVAVSAAAVGGVGDVVFPPIVDAVGAAVDAGAALLSTLEVQAVATTAAATRAAVRRRLHPPPE